MYQPGKLKAPRVLLRHRFLSTVQNTEKYDSYCISLVTVRGRSSPLYRGTLMARATSAPIYLDPKAAARWILALVALLIFRGVCFASGPEELYRTRLACGYAAAGFVVLSAACLKLKKYEQCRLAHYVLGILAVEFSAGHIDWQRLTPGLSGWLAL